jgi:hypothetical protein
MAILTGKSIASTYKSLLNVSGSDNAELPTNSVTIIEDGAGNDSSLSLGTDRATITLGSDAGDDFIVDGTKLVVQGDTSKVGIGTTSPDGTLHVHTATAGSITAHGDMDDLVVENSGNAGITILSPNASASSLAFGSPDDSDGLGAAIQWKSDDNLLSIITHNAGDMICFRTGNSSQEVMRMKADGKIGIGTDSPTHLLEIEGAHGVASLSAENGMIFIGDGDTGIEIGRDTNTPYGMWFQGKKLSDNTDRPIILNPVGDRVGIGTTNPIANLHVSGTSISDGNPILTVECINAGADTGPDIMIYRNDSDPQADDYLGTLTFRGKDSGGNDAEYVDIYSRISNPADGSESAKLYFRVADNGNATNDIMMIDGSKVGIGTTSPGTPLDVRGSSNSAAMLTVINEGDHANAFGVIIHAGTDAASSGSAADSRPLVFNDGDGTALGGVNAGTTGAPAFYAASDERLKENIVNTTIVGLDVINNLPLKKFNFKKFGTDASIDIGFIAQDCESVYPKMVSELDDDASKANWNVDHAVKTVSDTTLIPVLVKAIQELSAKVTALENA